MREKLQKSIADILNSDIQADMNEYHDKAVLVSYKQILPLKKHIECFSYPDFEALFGEIEHINHSFVIYNSVKKNKTEILRFCG